MAKRERDLDDTLNNNHNKKPRLQHELRVLGDGTQVCCSRASWIKREAYLSPETVPKFR